MSGFRNRMTHCFRHAAWPNHHHTETNQPVSQPNIKPVSQSEVRPDSHTSKQSETKCKHWSGCQLAKTALYNRQHGWTTLYRIAKRYVSQRHFCCDVEIFSTCSVFTRRWTEIVKTTSSETVAWWNAVSHFKYPKKTVTRTKLRNLRRQKICSSSARFPSNSRFSCFFGQV